MIARGTIDEIKVLRETYGQRRRGDAREIPSRRIAMFLEDVEALARERRVRDAAQKVEDLVRR